MHKPNRFPLADLWQRQSGVIHVSQVKPESRSPPLLTWHIHHVKAVPSDLDVEPPCRHIGIYTMARLSLVWIAHTGKTVISSTGFNHPNPQVPAFPNASPLRKSASPDSASVDQSTPHESPWPLVIFSHGLGGGGTTYRSRARASIVCFQQLLTLDNSQLCTHLASSGKVVIAMEHRDGTGPICRSRSEATGERSSRLYISPSEVV